MGFKCLVSNCENIQKDTILHSLPKDVEMFKKWLKAVGREDINHNKRRSYRVCDKHFTNEMKFVTHHNRTNLTADAFPVLYLSVKKSDEPASTATASTSTAATANTDSLLTEDVNTEQYSTLHANILKSEKPQIKRKKIDIKKKINILRECGFSCRKQLSPQTSNLYAVAKNILYTARKLYDENSSNKKRIVEAMEQVEKYSSIMDKVNLTTLKFIEMQLRLQKRKNRGRRYTIKDKTFALSLLKQSPKGYKLLQKTFVLPSRQTLMSILNKIPFNCGINQAILNSLKKSIARLDKEDRCCILMFDEMSIEAALMYNRKKDVIYGFEDDGDGKKKKLADHALVFMARGLKKKWKQPICYYFFKGGISTAQLTVTIKNIICSLQNIGLNIIGTVCDQATVNTAAINRLKEETKRKRSLAGQEDIFGFEINNKEIIPVYDPPHLLKGIRNNLLKADVKFTWNHDEQRGSWKDVVALYELDKGDDDMRMLNKLTEGHVYKEKMKKMKVKVAAQIFSHRVSSTMRGLVLHGNTCLDETAVDTADFLLLFDKIFDSTNSLSKFPDQGKPLRGATSQQSEHIRFWYEAIKVLETIRFITNTGREFVPPSVKNWIVTLRGFIYIWQKLQGLGYKYLCTRNINQDPLENLYGCIRSHGVRNINPSCASFVASFKSLIINNFVSPHSPGRNCEEDTHDGALNSLEEFLQEETIAATDTHHYLSQSDLQNGKFNFKNRKHGIILMKFAYTAGYLARRIVKIVGGCGKCKFSLVATSSEPFHALIEARTYSTRQLTKPNTAFINLFSKCIDIIQFYLPKLCFQEKVHFLLSQKIFNLVEFEIKCDTHDLPKIFVNEFVSIYIYTWTKHVNNILKGVETKSVNDSVKELALIHYRKQKARKEAFRKEKQLQ